MDRFEKSVICVGALTSFFGVFLATAVSIALPDIGAEFGMTDVAQNYVTLTFLLAVAALTIPAGFVSGKFGVKKMMCFGIAIYVISSIVAIFSVSQEMFIGCRLFQGLGCAFLDVGSISLVTCAFDPEVRGKALGLTVVGAYLATSLAAPLGGFLNTMWGWRSIFCFGVPFLAICLILLITVINKEWSEYANIPIDIKGCVLYVIGIVLAIFGFTMLTEPFGLTVMIIGIILIVVFILVELRVKFPAFDVRLFKNPKFASSNFAALSGYLATMAITTIINYYLQYIRSFSSAETGLILLVTPVLQLIMAPIAGRLSDRINPQILAAVGIACGGVGIFVISNITTTTPIYILVSAMALQGFGFGLFSSPNTNTIMGSAPPEKTTTSSSAVATMRVVGQALSMGMFTLVMQYFMGNVAISPAVYPQLLTSCQVAAGICSLLCLVSVFSSLVGLRSKGYYNKG